MTKGITQEKVKKTSSKSDSKKTKETPKKIEKNKKQLAVLASKKEKQPKEKKAPKKRSPPPPIKEENLPSIGDIYILNYAHTIKRFIIVTKMTNTLVRFEGISSERSNEEGDSLYASWKIKPLADQKNGKTYSVSKFKFEDDKSAYGVTYARDGHDGSIELYNPEKEELVKVEHYY